MLKRSHLSEKTCREIIQLFSDDLTATQIAAITNVSRVTINNYLKLIRTHIARHCEELGQRFNNTKTAAPSVYRVHAATERAAEENSINAYYGFYSVTGNVYTDELTAVSKPVIREFQQASWLHRQEAGHLHELSRYHAIADFDHVIALSPMSAFAFDLRGAAYLDKGDLAHAKADYGEAAKLDPTDEMAARELNRLR